MSYMLILDLRLSHWKMKFKSLSNLCIVDILLTGSQLKSFIEGDGHSNLNCCDLSIQYIKVWMKLTGLLIPMMDRVSVHFYTPVLWYGTVYLSVCRSAACGRYKHNL